MSGIDYLVDTNVLIHILEANPNVWYFATEDALVISCISELELLSKYQMLDSEIVIAENLLKRTHIFEMDRTIKKIAINIKRKYRIKLPDAIIAATAICLKVPLISCDRDFDRIKELELVPLKV